MLRNAAAPRRYAVGFFSSDGLSPIRVVVSYCILAGEHEPCLETLLVRVTVGEYYSDMGLQAGRIVPGLRKLRGRLLVGRKDYDYLEIVVVVYVRRAEAARFRACLALELVESWRL